MAKYINADELCGWLETVIKDFGEPNISIRPVAYGSENALRSVLEVVKKQPTADVVEVVRCEKCVHWIYWADQKRCSCELHHYRTKKYDFCSYGRRK